MTKKEPAPRGFNWQPLPKYVLMIGGPECGLTYLVQELTSTIEVGGYTQWTIAEPVPPDWMGIMQPVGNCDRIHTYKRGCAYVSRVDNKRVLVMEYLHAKIEAI